VQEHRLHVPEVARETLLLQAEVGERRAAQDRLDEIAEHLPHRADRTIALVRADLQIAGCESQ
jgi:hypothetical protein